MLHLMSRVIYVARIVCTCVRVWRDTLHSVFAVCCHTMMFQAGSISNQTCISHLPRILQEQCSEDVETKRKREQPCVYGQNIRQRSETVLLYYVRFHLF